MPGSNAIREITCFWRSFLERGEQRILLRRRRRNSPLCEGASGSHPGHQVAATETPSQNTVGNNGNKSAAPVPPPRNTTGPKLSGRGVGTDGGKGVVDARERDLEAQIHHGGQDSIRYTRED